MSVVQQAHVRRLDAPCRPAGRELGAADLEVGGEPHRRSARRAGRGRSRAPTRGRRPMCSSTRRSRGSGTAAGSCASASLSVTPCTKRAGGTSSALTSVRRRPRRYGANSCVVGQARPVRVQLAISDAHPGLKAALAQLLACAWQRCSVHFLRDCLGHARKDQHGLLGALIRPIFQTGSGAEARVVGL